MMHVPSPSRRSRSHYVIRIFLILTCVCFCIGFIRLSLAPAEAHMCLLSTWVLGPAECLWSTSRIRADPTRCRTSSPLPSVKTADTEKLRRRKVSDSLRRFGEQAVVSPSDPAHLSDYSPPPSSTTGSSVSFHTGCDRVI